MKTKWMMKTKIITMKLKMIVTLKKMMDAKVSDDDNDSEVDDKGDRDGQRRERERRAGGR